ncbi:MAG: flagellar biosynthesis protein FlhA [Verrucomicrobiales bacterium]|nr:flagellar biosynthesis protein FlhA [Verrucomicrobiales bacterium]|tara:strand:+ start:44299 stop:46425 length:2127 start_codon:yes stop_codon:yes gene_type:complete
MSAAPATTPKRASWAEFGLIGFIFSVLLWMILPLQPWMLDFLLALSISSGLLVMLVIIYIREPSEFTSFPTLLLIITLFRLGINVASTRLILGEAQAGQIIQSFGNVVVQGNYVVGFVVFLILTLINFVVITKGAGRIAEVAARFTLDAMPGKQMAIDAELNAGLIKEDQARKRRDDLSKEADFYGSMDGASKFVRGDAIAGILITLVNVVGGIGIGVIQRDMDVSTALQTYTVLSIGDGLVSQIPALVISTAAGILVTRAAENQSLGQTLTKQLFLQPKVLMSLSLTMFVLSGFSLVTGVLPWFPFFMMGVLFGFMHRSFDQRGMFNYQPADGPNLGPDGAPGGGDSPDGGEGSEGEDGPDKLEDLLNVDTLQIELGYGLLALADPKKGGDILERVTSVRRNFVQDMGFIIPAVRLRDNLELGANEYRFIFRGQTIANGEVMPGYWLAMNTNNSTEVLPGVQTVEPVFGLDAVWITEVERKNAEVAGYTVVDAASVLVTHFSETIKRYCHQILSRQDVQVLLDNLKEQNPALINELVPGLLSVGQVQRVLQNLLSEGVPIRNLVGVLERVADYAGTTKNTDELAEQARRAIGGQIVRAYQDEMGAMHAITLDPWLEEELAKGLRPTPTETTLLIDPKMAEHLSHHFNDLMQPMIAEGRSPVVICSSVIRAGLRRFFAAKFPDLAFLSYEELPPKVEIVPAGAVPSLS